MTLLTICTGLAKNVGLALPDVVATSPFRQWQEALQMVNDAGDELARRVDWSVLRKSATLTGDGTAKVHAMPADFARFGQGITLRSGSLTVRPLTRSEWNALVMAQGTPRYFLAQGATLQLWPYLANAATVAVQYQSKEWASGGAAMVGDTDTALLDEDLILKGLIVRWRRQKGMDYADMEAEYEAALADLAQFDDRSRL